MEAGNLNVSLVSLWTPEYLPISAWLSHGSFAFWLADVLRPKRFVELGTHYGYSYFAICQAVRRLQLDTLCFAIDTWQGDEHAGLYGDEVFVSVSRRNEIYRSFSTLMRGTFEEGLKYFEDRSIDLLHIDGRHYYEDVKHDYESWLPKMADECVVLFHDTNVRERGFGVWRLFDELKRSHPSFEFVHGHGLGVLCPGPRVPEALSGLLSSDPESTRQTRLAYAALGATIEQRRAATLREEGLRHVLASGTEPSPESAHALAEQSAGDPSIIPVGSLMAAARERAAALDAARNETATLREALDAARNDTASLRDALHIATEAERAATMREASIQQHAGALADRDYLATQALRKQNITIDLFRAKALAHRSSSGYFDDTEIERKSHLIQLSAVLSLLDRSRRSGDARSQFIANLCLRRKHSIDQLRQRLSLEEVQRRSLECEIIALRNGYTQRAVRGLKDLLGFQPAPRAVESIIVSEVEQIIDSGLFDFDYYRQNNPDVLGDDEALVQHFCASGWREGRKPSVDFDPVFYLATNPDVAESGENPVIHFVDDGMREGRAPIRLEDEYGVGQDASALAGLSETDRQIVLDVVGTGMFDAGFYEASNPDVVDSGESPLVHFSLEGWREGRRPNPYFDPAFYLATYVDVRALSINPLVHYAISGLAEGRVPNRDLAPPELLAVDTDESSVSAIRATGLFDEAFYRTQNPDLDGSGIELARHFATHGWREGRRPNPHFDPAFYVKANPDVAGAGINPLLHFASLGLVEGRPPAPELAVDGAAPPVGFSPPSRAPSRVPGETVARDRYARWIAQIEPRPLASDGDTQPADTSASADFALLVPQKMSGDDLFSLITSLQRQTHHAWTLVLPRSDDVATAEALRLVSPDIFHQVTFVDCGHGDRGATLQTLFMGSTSSHVAVLDPGDLLKPSALLEVAAAFASRLGSHLVYSDEDMLSPEGRRISPLFKPDFSPQLLQSYNYFGRFTALSSEAVRRVGGFNSGEGAAAEWSINLRIAGLPDATILRIPRVLCHRGFGSPRELYPPMSLAAQQCRRMLAAYWRGQDVPAPVVVTQPDGTQRSTWRVEPQPLVSIIIPNHNQPDVLRTCLEGVLDRTEYRAIEVIVVENNSTDPRIFELYEELERRDNLRVVRFDAPFNYSAVCNTGAEYARGEILLFLNNDIEVIDAGWLNEMVRVATLPRVGIVGTKLSYPDGTLQHGGVAVGIHLYALMFNRGEHDDWGIFGSPDHPRNWLAIMGACQMVRRSVFEEVGRFDESYHIANSDVALCLRAYKAGWLIAYTPYAALIHHEGKTRGHSNPPEDMVRSAREVRRLGIAEDPYLHPQLSSSHVIPMLLEEGEPSIASNLIATEQSLIGSENDSRGELDLADDHAVRSLTGLAQDVIQWPPQAASGVVDRWSAARFVIDLLRRRVHLRSRFPRALSEGTGGDFLRWLQREGAAAFGLSPAALAQVQEVFVAPPGDTARKIYLYRDDVKTDFPLGLLPQQRPGLLRWFLCHGRKDHGLRTEEIWWLFLSASEAPEQELVRAYSFNTEWQSRHPLGMTVFGQEAFALWLVEAYRISPDAAWLRPERWPAEMTPAEQLRLAYRLTSSWQHACPGALDSPDRARALLEWLQSPTAGLPHHLRSWSGDRLCDGTVAAMVAKGVNVLAHFCFPSGLRVSAETMCASLDTAGVQRSLRNVRTFMIDEPQHARFAGREIHDVTVIHAQPEPFFDHIYKQCDLVPRRPRTHRVAYWYWELDRVPDHWRTTVEQVDEVWTATEFVAAALRPVVEKPVFTLFPGVRIGTFERRSRRKFGLPGREDGRFAFLFSFHMGSVFARKNPLGLISSFRQAFSPEDPVDLVLKTTTFGNHEPELRKLRDAAGDAHVHILDRVLSDDENLSLMDACDAYASLHRSEGLGLTMAEAMLLGKPVIASRYSGNLDFMTDDNSLLVDCTVAPLVDPAPPYNIPGARWAVPDEAQAASHMRRVFTDERLRCDLAERARRDALRDLSLDSAGQRFAARLAEIQNAGTPGSPRS